jgi:hypothetical protein
MKSLLLLPGLLLAFAIPQVAMAQAYPKPVVDEIMRSCASGAPANAAAGAISTQCQCVVNSIQSRVSLADYTELDAALKAQKPLTEKQNSTLTALVQSGKSCQSSK